MTTVDSKRLREEAGPAVAVTVAAPVVRPKKAFFIVKRLFDMAAAALGLVVLFLPMLIIGVIIMIDSPGGAIYRQERLGKNGRPFMIYKFRTMYLDAEDGGPRWAEKQDRRCTSFGSFLRNSRLDELPQLYNILRGEMSLVGPRPERAYFYEKFEKYIPGFSNRLLVTPGLTGWAQVRGGYDLKPEEKILYDMEYIEKQSLRMDLTCILKTFGIVFSGDGAR